MGKSLFIPVCKILAFTAPILTKLLNDGERPYRISPKFTKKFENCRLTFFAQVSKA
jgi:hypothetical protein